MGVIQNLTAYNAEKKFIRIVGPDGEKIKYHYPKDKKDEIIKQYDRGIINIAGVYNTYNNTINNISVFEEVKSLTLKKLKDIDFSMEVE